MKRLLAAVVAGWLLHAIWDQLGTVFDTREDPYGQAAR